MFSLWRVKSTEKDGLTNIDIDILLLNGMHIDVLILFVSSHHDAKHLDDEGDDGHLDLTSF